jgi:CHASE2 domain-containing sensor protein
LKSESWALTVFPRDEDLRLRRFSRTIEVSADPLSSSVAEPVANWAARIADVYCLHNPGYHCAQDKKDEVFMSFDADAVKSIPVLSVFRCRKAASGQTAMFSALDETASKRFTDSAKGGVLLIGGTFRNGNDIHDTPQGPIAGLRINAYAILALIRGPYFSEVGRLWTFLPDVVLGCAIVYLFWRLSSIQSMILATIALLPFTLIVSGVILYLGYVWLTCIGVALGIMPHALLEIYKMNPAMPKRRHS